MVKKSSSNPAEDQLNVSFDVPNEGQLSLINITGQIVYSQKLPKQHSRTITVQLEHLAAGIYLLSLVTETSRSSVKFIKQ